MSPAPTLPGHVNVSISYRPISDTAVVSFDDLAMASYIERRGAALRQVSIDYDTTVECTDVLVDGESSALLVGAQIIGAGARHRAGLVHDSLPSDIRRHLLGLLVTQHVRADHAGFDPMRQVRVSAVVPVSSLVCPEPTPSVRPLHEVKAVVAALSDLAAVLRSLPVTSWAGTFGDDQLDDLVVMSALVDELSTALDGARGMSTPAIGSRIVDILDLSPVLPSAVRRTMRESVIRVCDVDDWSVSARDIREVAQALKNLRP